MALLANLRDMPGISEEQRIFINQIYGLFDFANRRITDVDELYYQGHYVGSPFQTFIAGQIFLAFRVQIGCNDQPTTVLGTTSWYDENNALIQIYYNNDIGYHTVIPNPYYLKNHFEMRNIFFGRVAMQRYTYITFEGYRITWV